MLIQVYLKAPRPGTVKTRLAHTLGDEEACRIYMQLVKRQLAALPPAADVAIHFAPADAAAEIHQAFAGQYPLVPQCAGNLGDRLANGIARAFQQGAASVCVIGADCPDLHAHHFQQTEALLQAGAELVVGPARDGGYYLLAVNRFMPMLFQEIPWSSPHTLAATLAAAEKMKLKVAQLQLLDDVDFIGDWQRISQRFS